LIIKDESLRLIDMSDNNNIIAIGGTKTKIEDFKTSKCKTTAKITLNVPDPLSLLKFGPFTKLQEIEVDLHLPTL